MDSEKFFLIGIGFLGAGLFIAIGIMRQIFPDKARAKRLWSVVAPAVIIGAVLIVVGMLKK